MHSLNLDTKKTANLYSLSHIYWRGMHPWWGSSWNILHVSGGTLGFTPIIPHYSCTLLGLRCYIFPTISTGVLTRCLILCNKETLHNRCKVYFITPWLRWFFCINWRKRVFHGSFSLPMRSSQTHNPILNKMYPHHLILLSLLLHHPLMSMFHHLHMFLHLKTTLLHQPLPVQQTMREVIMSSQMRIKEREMIN